MTTALATGTPQRPRCAYLAENGSPHSPRRWVRTSCMRAVNRQPWLPRDRLVEMVQLNIFMRFSAQNPHKTANFANFADFPVFLILTTIFKCRYTVRDPNGSKNRIRRVSKPIFHSKPLISCKNRPCLCIFNDFCNFRKSKSTLTLQDLLKSNLPVT